jgi:hypothetical protein
MKHDRTIFHSRVGLVRIGKMHTETRYGELVFLHLVRLAGLVVHSSVSGA